MKWWVWVILVVLVISGVFWLYVFLTKDAKNKEKMAPVRDAKSVKTVEKNNESELKEEITADAGTT